jgi:signal transduction histidine kinase
MTRGGTLTVRTSRAQSSDGANWVSVAVRDTGTGIDTETQKRLFEPFFTTKDPRKSLGLGLATARGLMAQMGGYIRVETAPGAGTNISLLLPPAARSVRNAPVGAGVAGTQA